MVAAPPRPGESSGALPVIANGYCIGCGNCAALDGERYEMHLTEHGLLSARTLHADTEADLRAGRVCPFSEQADNENVIASRLFPDAQEDARIGRYQALFAGYVAEPAFRQRGSSGGMATWLFEQLIKLNLVDGVVHVGCAPTAGGQGLYSYRISRSIDELRNESKSKYYPTTLVNVIAAIRETPGRYAFSGVPCFVKAIRLMAGEDRAFGACVAYCIGLVCGHMKSGAFAEFLAWQMGISPDELTGFDFRVKLDGKSANRYGVSAQGQRDGQPIERRAAMSDLFGQDWGLGLFKPKACDYCDDVFAETADISVGDAWLPRYVNDGLGTNLVVVRNPALSPIVDAGIADGRIHLESLPIEAIVQSQASGLSHRRVGLAYRLWLADASQQWRPTKRVEPCRDNLGRRLERRQRLRIALAETSHAAFLDAKRAEDLKLFFTRILPLSNAYLDISKPFVKRQLSRIKRWLRGNPAVRRAINAASKKTRETQ